MMQPSLKEVPALDVFTKHQINTWNSWNLLAHTTYQDACLMILVITQQIVAAGFISFIGRFKKPPPPSHHGASG